MNVSSHVRSAYKLHVGTGKCRASQRYRPKLQLHARGRAALALQAQLLELAQRPVRRRALVDGRLHRSPHTCGHWLTQCAAGTSTGSYAECCGRPPAAHGPVKVTAGPRIYTHTHTERLHSVVAPKGGHHEMARCCSAPAGRLPGPAARLCRRAPPAAPPRAPRPPPPPAPQTPPPAPAAPPRAAPAARRTKCIAAPLARSLPACANTQAGWT